jgi:predicted PurR-regulated permease PerM
MSAEVKSAEAEPRSLVPKSFAAEGTAGAFGDRQRATGRSVVSLTTLAVIVVVCAILYLAKDLFLPLALGMLCAFVLSPLVNAMRSRGVPEKWAVVLTVLVAAVLVGGFVLTFAYQLSQIGANLPRYQGNVLSKIDSLLEMGKDSRVIAQLQEMVADISARLAPANAEAEGAGSGAVRVELIETTSMSEWLNDLILPALAPVAIFGLIAVVVVFALLERAALRDRLVMLIGGTNILATSRLLADAGSRVSSYLVAQLVVNIIYAVPIWLGLWLIGVPNALFFGIVTMVLRFVPYVGSAVSAILPLVMAFAVAPDWSLVLWTAALFGVVELVTSNVVEPWFYGRRTGISPLAVIVSAMFWTWLWGPLGLIIATPLTVCLVVIGHHVPSLRVFSIMLGDNPVLEETARLYDRLLTGHAFAFDEASALSAGGSTVSRKIATFYDLRAIPALAMAQADYEAGLLSDLQTNRIADAVLDLTERMEVVIEDATESEQAADSLLPGEGHRVVVMGARTQLEDAAAELLAQAMRAEGSETMVLTHRAFSSAMVKDFAPKAIVLVTLDGVARSSLEVRLRQLRRRFAKVPVLLAAWDQPGDHGHTTDSRADPATRSGMAVVLEHVFDRPPADGAAEVD